MALPAIADVRRQFSDATLALAARSGLAPLFESVPGVDVVVRLESSGKARTRWRADAQALRAQQFDLAILLPYTTAYKAGSLFLSPLYLALDRQAPAGLDLINLRMVSTVFQTEIIHTGRRIFCADETHCIEFERLRFHSTKNSMKNEQK